MFKRIFRKLFPGYTKQLINFLILSKKYGQLLSIQNEESIDADGSPLPWYTYPAIEYLKQLDLGDKSIFEYGSGNSSLFWAKMCKHFVSVENDEVWYNRLSALSEEITILFEKEEHHYVNSIRQFDKKFDVIIIDGAFREECVKVVKDYLNLDNGMVIFDNSDWYKKSSEYLREVLDLIQIDFHGFGCINSYTWTTSIFLTRDFRFNPKDNFQPHYSVAALRYNEENEKNDS